MHLISSVTELLFSTEKSELLARYCFNNSEVFFISGDERDVRIKGPTLCNYISNLHILWVLQKNVIVYWLNNVLNKLLILKTVLSLSGDAFAMRRRTLEEELLLNFHTLANEPVHLISGAHSYWFLSLNQIVLKTVNNFLILKMVY